MKYILLTLLLVPFMACSQQKSNLIGKTYYYDYMYLTTMNEYGKGGGIRYLSITFGKDKTTIQNFRQDSNAKEDGTYDKVVKTLSFRTVPYCRKGNKITIVSTTIPELIVEGDTLTAPLVYLDVNGGEKSFSNAQFTLKNNR